MRGGNDENGCFLTFYQFINFEPSNPEPLKGYLGRYWEKIAKKKIDKKFLRK